MPSTWHFSNKHHKGCTLKTENTSHVFLDQIINMVTRRCIESKGFSRKPIMSSVGGLTITHYINLFIRIALICVNVSIAIQLLT